MYLHFSNFVLVFMIVGLVGEAVVIAEDFRPLIPPLFLSPDNTSYFHQVLQALLPLYKTFFCTPPTTIPVQIRNDWGQISYFDDVRGAIDGTQVLANVPAYQYAICQYRKDTLSQHVLAGCSLDRHFFDVCPRWEASANHPLVMHNAELNRFPRKEGGTHLADAGYGLRNGFLTPYRTVLYHLREQVQARLRPVTIEEVFNL